MDITITKEIADHAAAILKGYESLEALKSLLADDDVTIRGPKVEFKHSADFSDEQWNTGTVTVKRPKYEFSKCQPIIDVYLNSIKFKIDHNVDLATKEAIAWDKHLESLKDKPSAEEIEADVEPEDNYVRVETITIANLAGKINSATYTKEEGEVYARCITADRTYFPDEEVDISYSVHLKPKGDGL